MKKTSARSLFSKKLQFRKMILLLLCITVMLGANAATITVSSLSALQTAINNASPGDVIILSNGVYTTTADITISKQGTASQPITIQAQSILGAEIKGSFGFAVNSPAQYVIIKGFKFTHAASQATMASGTSFIRWTQNLFQNTGDGDYLLLNGNDHQVDYNTFQNKTGLGKFIIVRGTGSQIAQRLWVHHNYFSNQPQQSGNGNETIQFGLSGYSMSSTNSIFEYNLFENCAGENELLSVKASRLVIRFNTVRDCPAQLTLRHGNFCEVYGNYFINTPGLRIFGDDHKIYSNHYESCSVAINIGNGDGEVADGDALTVHDRPDRCFIVYNTLVNNTANYRMDGRTNGLGATNTTFANNIIQGGGAAATIGGPNTGAVWSNNIIYQTSGAGAMPSGSYTTVNPLLARDATGTFHLQSGSPAINAGTGSYSWANKDMDGQSRTGSFDIGADEVSAATVTAQILSPSMVGPNAGTPPVGGCDPVSASGDDGNVAGNVLDNDLNTRWSASGDGQWIQFCLGDTVAVSAVKIAFYNGNVRASLFDLQVSNNGSSWTNVATGLQSSGTSTALETFSFTQVQTKYVRILGHGNTVNAWNSYTEVVIVQQTNNAPTVSISSPANNAGFTAPATVGITAVAADSDGTISKVEFFNGATKLGEALSSPYTFNWSNVAAGNYVLTAKATDNGNASTTSAAVNISVAAAPACAPVSASADDGNIPANVLDNDLNTRWSATGDGQWIQFCLNDTVSVTGVQIAFFSGDVRTSTFDVLVGNNGSTWTTAASGRVSSGTSTALETFSFTPVTGKYVRIVGHGNSVNAWNSYTEVKIQTGNGGAQTFTLAPEADAYVRDGTNGDITHGTTDGSLLITKLSPAGQLNNARESYLRFDLTSVSGTVSSATLRVYGKIDLTTVPSVPIGVYAVSNTTWNESTLTWNNKPASGTGLDTNTVTNTAYAYITFDVTSYVQSELAASRIKLSFAMKSLTAHDPRVFWNSKEAGSNPPQLVVQTAESLVTNAAPISLQAEHKPELRSSIFAYPNPFRASSKITFRVQQSGNTELTVFDIQGRRVAVLVNGYLSAGEHRTQFTPPAGAKGIYLLRLVNGGKAVTHRIVQE
ncbi:DUF7594 domain-containing protein [Pseudobacter ginsenosidimutans]|uniref:Putative secreted protein (Por secretion system target) n=1 Tax=Pseudobacter ginsenosidimutans TaxID=661488 RepID=A0A4Q7N190_9BACT|nr:discoidin domain-containing protein [Pseudobacter ginsenosidimutans]QEC43938.1 DNRLRE domain-containing protein [Pseudobacter ginsenosidimutans]RZS75370.1 putative secreted protein (Por secretion system target) [Pseudobacter ginsenosidimutans]